MLTALHGFSGKYSFTVEVVDVDADEALMAEYDELVPVLLASRDGAAKVRICHYFLDVAKLIEFLSEGGAS